MTYAKHLLSKIAVLLLCYLLPQFDGFATENSVEKGIHHGDVVYFIPGSLYNKGQRTLPFLGDFNADFISTAKAVFGEDFVVIQGGVPKIPFLPFRVLWSAHWAVVRGHSQLYPEDYPNLERVVNEIAEHYRVYGKGKRIHIIGSSYGSVLAAHASIALINTFSDSIQIEDLILSACMIHQDSELGLAIKELHQNKAIENLVYVNDSTDNTVGVSGFCRADANKGLVKIVFGDKSNPSIFWFNKHPHVKGVNDISRTRVLLNLLNTSSTIYWVRD